MFWFIAGLSVGTMLLYFTLMDTKEDTINVNDLKELACIELMIAMALLIGNKVFMWLFNWAQGG